ncbi:hypothetical protein JCM19046_1803 [Bacillus sp. JCM 19046]|nr:hypothetical protein JCM19045_2758 [Bacillus sp. JCM 19045]GAF17297.1 hypothetical protein JCM19046_1803 [Bacillus sp. JCM 19046]
MKPKKQMFEVGVNESINDCLLRMDQAGYQPVRRMEKPVFKKEGKQDPEWIKQQIVFEGKLKDSVSDKA